MGFCLRKRLLLEVPDTAQLSTPLWVHCASVGEFNTFAPILKELKKNFSIVLTYFSPRAKDFLEKRTDMWDVLFPLPIDIPPLVKKFERILRPKVLIVVERELWFSLVKFTKVKKILVNAYAKGSLLERLLAREYSLIVAREERDREIFTEEGARNVRVCGNLKLVQDFDPFKLPFIPREGAPVMVAGSTHRGEEEEILKAYMELRKHIKLKLVIAPRHIARADELEGYLRNMGIRCVRRSKSVAFEEVLLLDTLGELRGFYSVADIAFVGGTLVPVGGHNLMEPALLGKPVLFGPYIHKVEDMAKILLERGQGFLVSNWKDIVTSVREILDKGFKACEDLRRMSESIRECYLREILAEIDFTGA